MGALGCSEVPDVTGPGLITDPTQIYARLELSYHAITLSLVPGFDTVTLHATARTPTGAVVVATDTVSPVTYRIDNNSTVVRVSSGGTVTALTASSGVFVIASQTIGAVTLVDTAVVTITGISTPTPTIASISIHPLPGDSAKVDCSGRYADTVRARALDAVGGLIPVTVSAKYRSSDPAIATISETGVIQGLRPGQVTLSADAYYYGRGVRDSVQYTIGEPLVQLIWLSSLTLIGSPTPITSAGPADVVIGVGGSVSWMNGAAEPVDIVFDDPTVAMPSAGGDGTIYGASGGRRLYSYTSCVAQGGGNIPPLQVPVPFIFNGVLFSTNIPCASTGARSFTRAGTHTYRSSRTGVAGRVIVR